MDKMVELDEMFDEMIDMQRQKVLKRARLSNPKLSADDILQPFDYPDLQKDPIFHFEDGILAGLISAQAAVRNKLRNS